MRSPASGCERAMTLDYILASAATIAILAYLVYALLRPDRF
jgi:K+-transporting ATPase KdpF subunit